MKKREQSISADTLTPSFLVEKQKKRLSSHKTKKELQKEISKITGPIFQKVLKEESRDSMTIAMDPFKFVFRPNNYRLKVPLKEHFLFKKIALLKETYPTIQKLPMENVKATELTKKITIKHFKDTTIELNKTCVIVIFPSKKSFVVSTDSEKAKDEWIDKKVKDIEVSCMEACESLSKMFNLQPDYSQRIWVRQENEIHGEEFIDGLPKDLIIHDTYFKKVYPKGVEFHDTSYVKNYISNRALEKVSPDIVQALNNLIEIQERTAKNIEYLAENMSSHIPALQKLGDAADRLAKNTEDNKGGLKKNSKKKPTKTLQALPSSSNICPNCNSILTLKQSKLYCTSCGGIK